MCLDFEGARHKNFRRQFFTRDMRHFAGRVVIQLQFRYSRRYSVGLSDGCVERTRHEHTDFEGAETLSGDGDHSELLVAYTQFDAFQAVLVAYDESRCSQGRYVARRAQVIHTSRSFFFANHHKPAGRLG